jgi:thiol-disulfide isomerase/thioredoxin
MTDQPTRIRPRTLATVIVACALLVLTACSSGGASGGDGQDASSEAAMQFTGKTLEGASFDSAALAGKPSVLWFWAPWCTVCRAEAPDVAAVAAEFSDDVTFIGVPGRGEVGPMRQFVADTGTGGFKHVSDVDGTLWKQFGVVSQPSFVFIDASGQTELVPSGLSGDDLRRMTKSLVTS